MLTANLLQQLPLSFVVVPFGRQPHVPFVQAPEQQSLGDEHVPFCGTQHVPVTPQRGAVMGELYFWPQSASNVHAPPRSDTRQMPPLHEPEQQSALEPHDTLAQSDGMQHFMLSQYGVDGQHVCVLPHVSPMTLHPVSRSGGAHTPPRQVRPPQQFPWSAHGAPCFVHVVAIVQRDPKANLVHVFPWQHLVAEQSAPKARHWVPSLGLQ